MNENYIYIPDHKVEGETSGEQFRCRVPLSKTKQVFLVDGEIQPIPEGESIAGLLENVAEKGYRFELAEREVVPELVQVIQVRSNTAAEDIHYKSDFLLKKGSQAKVLLCSHTLSMHHFITNEEAFITLEEGAVLDMAVMQNEHNHSTHRTLFNVQMACNSVLRLHLITLHGGDISNKIEVCLNGKGGECSINGLYLADGMQQVSTDVSVSHNVPECHSAQLFKGILDGESITRFGGKIFVAPDAQKTEAYQANNNLISSKTAKAYTQPHLEIYADDVKCSHGATIGSLNEMELFYMRSRGITVDEAKLLQKQAFAYAVLEKISNDELRERLQSLVERRLRGEFSHCSNCSKHCC